MRTDQIYICEYSSLNIKTYTFYFLRYRHGTNFLGNIGGAEYKGEFAPTESRYM